MDLGLDEYSSDTSGTLSSRSHSDEEDVPIFELLTMPTAPIVKSSLSIPQSIPQSQQILQQPATIPLPTTSHQSSSSTSRSNPITLVTDYNPSLFKRDFQHGQKKAQEIQQQKDLRQQRYTLLKEKFKSKAPLTIEEAAEAKRLGFESEYSDSDQDSIPKNQISSSGSKNKNNGLDESKTNELLSFDLKNANVKRARVNLDAASDDYTGSWGEYEGECDNKARIHRLNATKKQKQLELEELGIDIHEQKRIEVEEARKTTSETSTWFLPIDPDYTSTFSSSSQYIDFEYNTPEYVDNYYTNQIKYEKNTPKTPQQVRKDLDTEQMDQRFGNYKNKNNNKENENENEANIKSCYDSHLDILLSGVFKFEETIPISALPKSSKSTTSQTTSTSATTKRLRSILDPPFGTKIDRASILLSGQQFEAKFVSKSLDKPFLHYQPQSNGAGFVKFFPHTASHLLVGGLDGTVKLYPTTPSESHQGDNGCIRSYHGHEKGLRDLTWVDDGKRFLTCSLDGWVKLWDTETGKVVFRENTTVGLFKGNATPMSAIVDHTSAMIGCGNGHITSYDFRSNEIIMDYSQMQQSITTMIEVPGGAKRNIMCASGDGNIYVYEWGVPSIYQYVMQHGRQMITRACLHPSEQFIVANTHANTVAIFKVENGKVKLNRKKTFAGHITAGYSLGLTCSPDGKYVVSGDGNGRLSCWEFKTGKLISQHKTHKNVASDVDWAWNHLTMFASCSWDGHVKVFK